MKKTNMKKRGFPVASTTPLPPHKWTPQKQEALYAAVLRDEDAAFAQLHVAYCKPLIYFAYNIVQSMEQAEDVVADTFVKLVLEKEGLNDLMHIKYFLYLVTRNAAIDVVRKRIRELECTTEYGQLFYLIDEPARPREEGVLQQDFVDKVYLGMGVLPVRCRKVLTLNYCWGLSVEEIAQVMGIHEQTVRNHRSDGLRKLREWFPFR